MECQVDINNVKIDFVKQSLMRFLYVTTVQMLLSFDDVEEPYKITL